MLRSRYIPILLLDDGELVKTRQFEEGIYVGDPINAIRIFNERYKVGYYFTAGYSNIFEKPRFGFKINFQGYDRYNNVWR